MDHTNYPPVPPPRKPAPAGELPISAFEAPAGSAPPAVLPAQPAPPVLPVKNPALVFIQRRFSNYDFMGLPLTLLVLVLLALPLIHPVVQRSLATGMALTLDQVFNKLMLCLRSPRMISLAVWVTYLGSRIIVTCLTLVMMAIFWLRGKKPYIVPMGVSVVGSALFMELGKLLYYRPRPLYAVYVELTQSYPSGHATLAVACYGFITYFLWHTRDTRRGRVLVLVPGALLVAAIAFSRLYLGVHFLSDVWSGVLLGSAWLAIAISIAQWRFHHVKRERFEGPRTAKLNGTIGGLLAAQLLLFVFLAGRFKAAVLPQGGAVALLTIEGRVRPAPAAGSAPPSAAASAPAAAGDPAAAALLAAARPAASAPATLVAGVAPPPALPAPAPVEQAVSGMNAGVMPATPGLAPKIIGSAYSGSLLAQHSLSRFTESLSSTTQEPLNFIIVGSQASLPRAFQLAGWTQGKTLNPATLFSLVRSATSNGAYADAPLTPSFWNGQPHQFGFEKAGEQNSVRERHHARFWRTHLQTADGQVVFVGTASFDAGMKWGGFTHVIAPDIDTERELLYQDLLRGGAVADGGKMPLVPPMRGKNAGGDGFFTDGRAYTLYLN